MNAAAASAAHEILDIMLRHLGCPGTITVEETEGESPALFVRADDQVATGLIGSKGERLDDLQHLVNKLLRHRFPEAPRVRLDINGYRSGKDDRFLDTIRLAGDQVRQTGETLKLEPMNSYERRLVHGFFKDDPDVRSWSPEDQSRLKRISLMPRRDPAGA
jgi:spoIIIJ-associated protein